MSLRTILNGLSVKYLTDRDHQYEPYNRYRILTRGLNYNVVNSGDKWHSNFLNLLQFIIIVSALNDKDFTFYEGLALILFSLSGRP